MKQEVKSTTLWLSPVDHLVAVVVKNNKNHDFYERFFLKNLFSCYASRLKISKMNKLKTPKLVLRKWKRFTPSTGNTQTRNLHTVLFESKMMKGGCCCLFFWLGGIYFHEKKEQVKVFNKNVVEMTILSHLRSIGDRTYTGQ